MEQRSWIMTPWEMRGNGEWKQTPVIVIGKEVFIYPTPYGFIQKLREMEEDEEIADGPFHEMIGQLLDRINQGVWDGQRRRHFGSDSSDYSDLSQLL